jgi:MarR family transcriptional regulator for hemolysin
MYTQYLCLMLTKQTHLVGSLIHDVAHLLRHEIDRRVTPYNLTRTKWLALSMLRERPGVSQSEFAELLELGAAATGRLADRLVERGFVERLTDDADRRVKQLYLTKQAEDVLRHLETEGEAMREELFGDLEPAEEILLQECLLKLKAGLKSKGGPND